MLLSPASPDFKAYYADLAAFRAQGAVHEQATRLAFTKLLDAVARPRGWTVLLEQTLDGSLKRPDATLQDEYKIPRGYWEAKDTGDDLDAEIQKKIQRRYPLTNTIFEDTRRAVLYQNGRVVLDADIREPQNLAAVLSRFFSHTDEHVEEFQAAIARFKEDIPDLAGGLKTIIDGARTSDPEFASAFNDFHALCKTALNPALRADAVEEMLVQHLLTERLFRTVLDNPEFTKRNAIASEIERVIDALTRRAFSRQGFLQRLDYFYLAIEKEAKTITTFSEKQGFLNTVYERFFQGFSRDQADTHGIVYTPQPIVDFMCESVASVLQSEFGQSLSDKGVTVLDPCTGTGNFLVNILRRLSPQTLRHKYDHELFANEVMLLPYYIASLTIEHTYFEKMGHYRPFEGLCFTDTLDLAESRQLAMFSEENTARVQKEKDAAITVIVGNPPYNVGQQNENDNNKNRRYGTIDDHIRATYVKDSKATLRTQVYDAYSRFFRWATDRLEDRDGVICFVTNNGFLEGFAFDGFRKHLAQDFTEVYHLDLGGNARKRGGGSVFNIMVGVGITLLVRRREAMTKPYPPATIRYHALDDKQSGVAKLAEIKKAKSVANLDWQILEPDTKNNWITSGLHADYSDFLPLGSKDSKASAGLDSRSIFKTYSPGVKTDRDDVVYNFDAEKLEARVKKFIQDYDDEVERWKNAGRPKEVDNFVDYRIKWSAHLKSQLLRGMVAEYDRNKIRHSLYRPYSKRFLYYDATLNDRPGLFSQIVPDAASENGNAIIGVTDVGSEKPFMCLMTDRTADLHLVGAGASTQCFPLYTYALNGKIRRDNITDWALGRFREKYGAAVTKPDIFHYVYALLHHPDYRERYKENLKRELPRVPLADGPAYAALAEAGVRLAALHVGYEQADEYPLLWEEAEGVPFSWRVTKMRLSPDKTALKINPSLSLTGLPAEAFTYRLGSRSALEWVIDQYQVSTDKRSGIVSDPNRADDPEYIVRLVARVVTVSVETARLVAALPPLGLGAEPDAPPPV